VGFCRLVQLALFNAVSLGDHEDHADEDDGGEKSRNRQDGDRMSQQRRFGRGFAQDPGSGDDEHTGRMSNPMSHRKRRLTAEPIALITGPSKAATLASSRSLCLIDFRFVIPDVGRSELP